MKPIVLIGGGGHATSVLAMLEDSAMIAGYTALTTDEEITIDEAKYENYKEEYKEAVLAAIETERLSHE